MDDLVLYSSAFGGSYEKYMTQVSTQTVTAIAADKINRNIDTASLQIQRGLVLNTKAAIENVRATTQLGRTMIASTEIMNSTMENGFTSISNELGSMCAAFSVGLNNISNAIDRMSEEICSRLDEIHDIVDNPLLTASRELYRRAAANYAKKFYEESLEDILGAVEKNKTDYISWFLAGQLYLFGVGEFSNVIDVVKAEEAFMNVVKYISPDIGNSEEATKLAAEAYYYLSYTQYILYNENRLANNDEESKKYLEKAIQTGTKSFSLSKEMYEALYNCARCFILQGRKEEAIKTVEELIIADSNYIFKVFGDKEFEEIFCDILNFIEEQRVLLKQKVETILKNAKQIASEINYDFADETIKLEDYYYNYITISVETDIGYLDLLKLSRNISDLEETLLREKENANTKQREYLKDYNGDLEVAKLLKEFTIGLCSDRYFLRRKSDNWKIEQSTNSIFRCLYGQTFLKEETKKSYYGKPGYIFFPYYCDRSSGCSNYTALRKKNIRYVELSNFTVPYLGFYEPDKTSFSYDAYECYRSLKAHYYNKENEIKNIIDEIEELTTNADKVKTSKLKQRKITTITIIILIAVFLISRCIN